MTPRRGAPADAFGMAGGVCTARAHAAAAAVALCTRATTAHTEVFVTVEISSCTTNFTAAPGAVPNIQVVIANLATAASPRTARTIDPDPD